MNAMKPSAHEIERTAAFGAAARALAENPSWARQSSVWLKVALWAFRYRDDPVPTRDDIAKALGTHQGLGGERSPLS
jgi:hypothetical protein